MASTKIFILILMYLTLLTIIINDVTNTTSAVGIGNPITYNSYNDFRTYNNLSDIQFNNIHGKWSLSHNNGLYPIQLENINNYNIGQLSLTIARCTIGQPIVINMTSLSESYDMYINTANGNYAKVLICTANYNLGLGSDEYYLKINNGEFYIEDISYTSGFITNDRLQDLNYNMGISREVNFSYNLLNNGNINPAFQLNIENNQVYNGIINNFIVIQNNMNTQKEITVETNNLLTNVYYVNQAYNPSIANFDGGNWLTIGASFVSTVLKICFFQIPTSIIPIEWQFFFFGIYDLAILYILSALLRGGS